MKRTALLVVIGKDRPGIIAEVTEILYRNACNLEDMSMTILEGAFAMIVVATFEASRKSAIDKALAGFSKKTGLSCHWTHPQGLRTRRESGKDQNLLMITAMGRDRTGIVHSVSKILARKKLNITDLNSRILGQGKKSIYAMALEVNVPKTFSVSGLEKSLQSLARKLAIEIQLKPVERLEL